MSKLRSVLVGTALAGALAAGIAAAPAQAATAATAHGEHGVGLPGPVHQALVLRLLRLRPRRVARRALGVPRLLVLLKRPLLLRHRSP